MKWDWKFMPIFGFPLPSSSEEGEARGTKGVGPSSGKPEPRTHEIIRLMNATRYLLGDLFETTAAMERAVLSVDADRHADALTVLKLLGEVLNALHCSIDSSLSGPFKRLRLRVGLVPTFAEELDQLRIFLGQDLQEVIRGLRQDPQLDEVRRLLGAQASEVERTISQLRHALL